MGSYTETAICHWWQMSNWSSYVSLYCSIRSRILDENLEPIRYSTIQPTSGGETCINYFGTSYYLQDYVWTGWNASRGGCGNPALWAQASPYYLDIVYFIEWWDTRDAAQHYFKKVSIRLLNVCYTNTITMGPTISTLTMYSGATLALTNVLGSTTFSPALSSNCDKTSVIQASNEGIWRGSSDAFYLLIITSFTDTVLSAYSSANFVANPSRFNVGLSSTYEVVPLRIQYKRTTQIQYMYFDLNVKPLSAVVALCSAQTSTLFSQTGAVTNQVYTVGATALTITPPTFTAAAPNDTLYSNTAMPKCLFSTFLQYSLDGTTWNVFPESASGATFLSTNSNASCVKYINPVNSGLTIYCTDLTKFATNGDTVVTLRYVAWWNTVEDQPTSISFTAANTNTFTLTIRNPCLSDVITLGGAPASTPWTMSNVYSGARSTMTAKTITHSLGSPCNTIHTKLVEVSADNGVTWYSSGATYSDLLSSANDDLAFVIEPKIAAFDAGTATQARKVRISVDNLASTQASQQWTYNVNVLPLSQIAVLADTQNASTLLLTQAHADVVYNIGQGMLAVPSTSISTTAPTATDNTGIRKMETETQLYYYNTASSAWVELTASWTVISRLDTISKAFTLLCNDQVTYCGLTLTAGTLTIQMKYTTKFKQISGLPASPVVRTDTFNLIITNKCYNDKLLATKDPKTSFLTYPGVTMTIPATKYLHSDGITDTDCPVTTTYLSSSSAGVSWDTGSNYVSSLTNGVLVLVPRIDIFGTTVAPRLQKVQYINSVTGVQAFESSYSTNILTNADLAQYYNDQLQTLSYTPHKNIAYTVGATALSVPSIDYTQFFAVDPLGYNNFSTAAKPAVTILLEFWNGSSWVEITTSNYLTTGVVGVSSTPCMLSTTLNDTTKAFQLSCTDNTKFGIDSDGKDVFELRYKLYYTLATSNIRYIYDPFTVTIFNQCTETTLSVADASRTAAKSAYVGSAVYTVASIEPSITKTPSTCTTIDYLVEVFDDSSGNWTSLITNALYAALITDGTTTHPNNNPAVKIKANASYFSAVRTVQVRVTYLTRYSQLTNGSNKVVDQFPVTVYPTGYVESCAGVTLSKTDIADFTLSAKHVVGTTLTDKTFAVTAGTLGSCSTTTLAWRIELIDPADGVVANPYSTYFSIAAATGVLSYTPPPASFLNGLPQMRLDFKITSTLSSFPSKTATQSLSITLNNLCVTSKFTSPSSQSAIYYQDGSNTATAVTAFTYTSDQIESDCNFTHQFFYRNALQDAWSTTQPAYVVSPNVITLAFTIQTSSVSIATAGDHTASRWVMRRHYNPYSGQEIVQEFEIYFVKSLFCMTKTAALVTTSTLNLSDAVVGTSKTILSQLNTNAGVFITGANTASNCQFTAACQIFNASTQTWIAVGSWSGGGITCDATGQWTINILTTNTFYNPVTTLTMRVVYEIVDSQVPLWENLSRQVISQFNLKIVSNCGTSVVSHTNFPNIIYYVGTSSTALTYSPIFSGADNSICPQTVSLSLKLDGSGDNWTTWSAGSFTLGGTAYTFITSFVTSGTIADLGRFVINYTTQSTFRPRLKFNARITLRNSSNQLTDTLYFDITMVDVCEMNELTLSTTQANVLHTIAPASTATADIVINWTTLSQNTVATYNGGAAVGTSCPITRELYVQQANATWLKATDRSTAGSPSNYASLTPALDWVTNFSNTAASNTVIASSAAFSVSASYNSAWIANLFVNSVGRSYQVKMVSYDANSKTSKSRVEEVFSVTFAYQCNNDQLCITSDGTNCLTAAQYLSVADASPNINYVAGSAAVTIPLSGKQSIAGCPLTITHQYFNPITQAWSDLSTILNTAITAVANGSTSVSVLAANANNFCPQKQYLIRVTYTSSQSLVSQRTAYDEYTVTIKAYANSVLSLKSSVKETYTYNIPESGSSSLVINPIDPAGTNTITQAGCPVTCLLEKLDASMNWNSLASTAQLAFVTSGTGVCGLTINFTTASAFWTGTAPNLNSLRTTYQLRIGVQYTNVLTATPGVYAVYDDFELVMQHHCYGDYFTLTTQKQDFTQTIYPVDQGGGVLFGKTAVVATAVTQSDGSCASNKVQTLEIYDEVTKVWIDYNSQTAADKASKHPFVQNYVAATAVFDVLFTSDLGTTWDGKVATMRIKTTNAWSGQPAGTVYDQWKVTFVYACSNDNLSITSLALNIQDQSYTYSAAAMTLLTPAITQSVTGCLKSFRLYGFSSVRSMWRDFSDVDTPLPFISSFSTTTGVATVSYAGTGTDTLLTGGLWKAKTVIQLKIVCTSTYSKTASKSAEDFFLLTMSDICAANKIALDGTTYPNANAGAAVNDFTYTIGGTAVSKTPLISTVQLNSSCPVTARLYVFDTAQNKWIDQTTPSAPYNSWINGFVTTSGQLTVYQAQGTYQARGVYQTKITYTDPLAINPAAITVEAVFDVTIVHTCDSNPFTISDQLDYTYTVPAGIVDANSPAYTIPKTTVSNQNVDSQCWLSYRTEMWDEATDKWVTLTAALSNASPRSTFIQANSYSDTKGTDTISFASNQYVLYLPFSSLTTFTTTYGSTPLKMRNSVTDVTGKVFYDEYNLTFKYACWTDGVSLTTNIQDQIYQFGSGAQLLTLPAITQSVSGCTLAFKVFGNFSAFGETRAWQDYSNCSNCINYIISAFSTTTGQITVTNAAGTRTTTGDLKPETWLELKIVATSIYSKEVTSSVEDLFVLKMRQSVCVDNKLAFDPASSFVYANHYGTSTVSDVSYQIGNSAVVIDPKYSASMATTGCPLTAQLFVLDEQTNQWVEDSGPTFTNTWIASFQKLSAVSPVAGYMTIYLADTGFISEINKTLKILIIDPLTQNPTASAIQTTFQVQVFHKCSRNTFTLNDTPDKSYEVAATGTATATNVPISVVSGSTAGCTLHYTIEILDLPTNTWTTISQANVGVKYTFIVPNANLDSLTTNTFDIATTNFGTWGNTIHQMRLRVKDPNSTMSGANQVDEFRVIISYICNLDEITITTQLVDQTYIFGSAAQALTAPVFAQLKTGCATTYALEIYNPISETWDSYLAGTHAFFISNWNASNGVVTISNSGSDGGAGTLKPIKTFQLRISLTSTYSTTTLKTARDEFTLTLQEGCFNNQLKMDGTLTYSSSGAFIADQQYKVTVTALASTLTLVPLYSSSLNPASCPLTASLFIWDTTKNAWVAQPPPTFTQTWVSAFLVSDSGAEKAGKLTIYKDSSTFITEKVFKVKISITDLQSADPIKNAISHEFSVDVYHACQRNTIAFTSNQANQQFVIKAVPPSTAVVIANSAVTTGELETTCTIVRSLEIFVPLTQTWVTYTSALASTYPWITLWTDPTGSAPHYTASADGFTVTTADYSTYDNENIPPSVFQLRKKVQDTRSTSATALVTDEFSIEIKYECDDDVVSLTSDITMFVYSTFPNTAQTIAANYAQTIAGCLILFKAEVYDGLVTGLTGLNQISTSTTSSWIDITSSGTGDLAWRNNFNAGALTILTNTAYDPYKDYLVRITYTSKFSQKPETQRTQVEQFILRLTPNSVCIWNTLAKTAEMSDWLYTVANGSTAVSRSPSFTRSVSSCKIYQKLYFFNDDTNVWIDYATNTASYPFVSAFADGLNTADTNIGMLSISATRASVATSFWKPFKNYRVKITLDDPDANGLQLLSYEFDLQLRDKCADNTITKNAELAEVHTQIIEAAASTLTPNHTILFTTVSEGCLSTATLEFAKTTTNEYIIDNTGAITMGSPNYISSFSLTDGILVIQTNDIAKYSIQKDYKLRITISLPESILANKVVSYYFQVTIKHKCADNQLSLNSNIGDKIYYIDYPVIGPGTASLTITPSVTSTQTTVNCPLTCTLEKWNKSLHIWQTEPSPGTWTWKTSFAALNTAETVVYTTDYATYHPITGYPNNKGWTDMDLRVTLVDLYSQNALKQVQDTFTLSIRRPCSDSTLQQTNNLSSFLYYIGSGNSATIAPLYTNNPVGCVPYFYLHFWDETERVWVEHDNVKYPFAAWTAATGGLVINTSDFNTYDGPYRVIVRITTMNTVSVFADEFYLTIKDKCRDATLTSGVVVKALDNSIKTEASPFEWYMWQYAQAQFDPIVVSATPTACSINYYATDVNFERTVISANTMVIDTSTTPHQVQALFRSEQTRFYYVRAVVKNVKQSVTVLTSEDKYFVRITNPCLRADQVVAKAITGFDYWIKGAAMTETITPFVDLTTQEFGNVSTRTPAAFNTGDNLCGPKTYRLYKSFPNNDRLMAELHDPVKQPWISLTYSAPNYLLQIQTNNPVYYTNNAFNFYLQVSLDNYAILNPINAVRWQEIPINLKNCQIGDLAFTEIADVHYNVYTPIIYIQMVKFTEASVTFPQAPSTTCGYTQTYSVKWHNFYDTKIPLPNWIVWNPVDFRFEVQSSDPKDINGTRQIYKLELTSSISNSDMNPIFQKTQVVNLIVENGCLLDQMTVVTSITDYTYYINENTEKDTWVQGNTPRPKIMTWTPQWTQSVQGCPVVQKLYRTPLGGSRTLAGSFEFTPIFKFDFTQIPLNVLWPVSQAAYTNTVWGYVPFTLDMQLTTVDYNTYDSQSWALSVVMESQQSTHANKEGVINFKLDIKDVCWDLPLSAFDTISATQTYSIWQSHKINHNYLMDSWGDYCGGSSYRLEYVSGPKLLAGGDPLTINIGAFYTSKTQYNTVGFASANPYFEGVIPDITWEGVHRVNIVAQQGGARPGFNGLTKLYRILRWEFTITFTNPCRIAVVTPRVITNMSNTVGVKTIVSQTYTDFADSASTILGNGYDKCGPRVHYVTRKTNANLRIVPDQPQYLFEYLTYTKVPLNTPTEFKFDVITVDYQSIGNHEFHLHVALLLYPTATEAVVPFSVMINPCIVKSFIAPADYFWNYEIGNQHSNYIFSYTQSPCKYNQKFSAALKNGSKIPSFMTMSETEGYFRVYATKSTDLGTYEVVITAQLNNLDIFSDPSSTIDPALKINKLSPPENFIYKSSFILTVNVTSSTSSYGTLAKKSSHAPFFVPTPTDLWFYAGDTFVKGFGPAYDTDSHTVTVKPDFGNAARFIFWDQLTNTMTVAKNSTTEQDIGQYPLSIMLIDDQASMSPNGDTYFGNVTYRMMLTVYKKSQFALTETPPDVRLETVFVKYNSSVIDVRKFDKNSILNASDTSIVKQAKPQFADSKLKEVVVQKDETKVGATNVTTPELPRISMNEKGQVLTSQQSQFTESIFVEKKANPAEIKQPKPYVKGMDESGVMKVGFGTKMKVPKDLSTLNNQKVALRWTQAANSYNETYLTPEGYRDFEIRPAIDLQFVPSLDGATNQDFTYEVIGFTADEMTIQVKFANPDIISSSGVSADKMSLTFWSTEFLQAENGLQIEEGQTISKNIIPQVDPMIASEVRNFGKSIGWLVLILVGVGICLSSIFGFEQTPFWLFFNIWQLFIHIPLLNLKIPGYAQTFWREQLLIWTMRNSKVSEWLQKLSKLGDEDKKSYTLQLEAAGFNSTQIYMNLGLLLGVPAIIISLMPIAWFIDSFASLPDKARAQYGGRKPLTKKPLLAKLTNLLTRYLMVATLDIMVCVFVCISTIYLERQDLLALEVNLGISLGLLAVFACFILFVAFYGVWRYFQAKKAETSRDYQPSGYVSTLFEGANLQHPERMTVLQLAFIAKQVAYAATIVFLYEDPVFQLFALLGSSIMFNCLLASTRPYYELYNFLLNVFNELAFIFVLLVNLNFTDFVTEMPTRLATATLLYYFMFAVLVVNVLFCVIGLVLSQRHLCSSKKTKEVVREQQIAVEKEEPVVNNPIQIEHHSDGKQDSSRFMVNSQHIYRDQEGPNDEEIDGTQLLRSIPIIINGLEQQRQTQRFVGPSGNDRKGQQNRLSQRNQRMMSVVVEEDNEDEESKQPYNTNARISSLHNDLHRGIIPTSPRKQKLKSRNIKLSPEVLAESRQTQEHPRQLNELEIDAESIIEQMFSPGILSPSGINTFVPSPRADLEHRKRRKEAERQRVETVQRNPQSQIHEVLSESANNEEKPMSMQEPDLDGPIDKWIENVFNIGSSEGDFITAQQNDLEQVMKIQQNQPIRKIQTKRERPEDFSFDDNFFDDIFKEVNSSPKSVKKASPRSPERQKVSPRMLPKKQFDNEPDFL